MNTEAYKPVLPMKVVKEKDAVWLFDARGYHYGVMTLAEQTFDGGEDTAFVMMQELAKMVNGK